MQSTSDIYLGLPGHKMNSLKSSVTTKNNATTATTPQNPNFAGNFRAASVVRVFLVKEVRRPPVSRRSMIAFEQSEHCPLNQLDQLIFGLTEFGDRILGSCILSIE
jgi:hypothetical protein